MFVRVHTGTVIGIDAHPVVVEARRGKGLPGMSLIGLAQGAVKEALIRVRAAITACDQALGVHRLVANLLPAELPKNSSAFDLPLAMAVLATIDACRVDALEDLHFFGALSLSGALEPVHGTVLMADLARRQGARALIVPYANAAEAAAIPDIQVFGVRHLSEVLGYVRGELDLQTASPNINHDTRTDAACLSEVAGQTRTKRALELAAAGGHNLLMVGPPGSGKTMLAKRLPGLLPELAPEEQIEVTRIYSAAGLLKKPGLVQTRPFRAPHHTASDVALCGGGAVPKPGEITLAHHGVLFLDEVLEFSRRGLDSLREPLEEGVIHIARAQMSLTFPAKVLLVVAFNPCPCGYFRPLDGPAENVAPDTPHQRLCLCAYEQVKRYQARLSGPLLDRIDLHVQVEPVPFLAYQNHHGAEPTTAVKARVDRARARQAERFDDASRTNESLNGKELRRHVPLDTACTNAIADAMARKGLSNRAVSRVLKVSRTVADLHDVADVTLDHVREALSYRALDILL